MHSQHGKSASFTALLPLWRFRKQLARRSLLEARAEQTCLETLLQMVGLGDYVVDVTQVGEGLAKSWTSSVYM